MQNSKPRKLELLAPARDAETALAAIAHGADAVYMGAAAFGARAAAGNSLEDIARVVEEAHRYGVRVYVTVNTIIFENELREAENLIKELYKAGVDALIVQDMSLLSMDIPPIELHASTQCDARTPEKIAQLARAGFSQIVVPREFSLEQIREAAQAAGDASIEVFVHGALCVSYSGDCQAGYAMMGRSANRGECPQICRLKFRLTDSSGNAVELPDGGNSERHWLSLADMNRLNSLVELAEAGASSFKIEGRLKSADYVKNVTAAYSQALDELVASSNGRYVRASYGRSELNFKPDALRSFNRGFTRYFLTENDWRGLSSWRTPKWVGQEVGKILEIKGKNIRISSNIELNNGDGFAWFDEQGNFGGFRANRVENGWIYPAPGSVVPTRRGTVLYRNGDAAFDALMARKDTARRSVGVRFTLRQVPDGRVAVDVVDERGCSVSITSATAYADKARSEQTAQRMNIFSRLGDTIYRLDALDDRLGDLFLPSSVLADLRRSALGKLDVARAVMYRSGRRRACKLPNYAFAGMRSTYHDNVANSLAQEFYEKHGAQVGEKALEASEKQGEIRVMTTRYCLRRELGACLKTPEAKRLPAKDLYLEAPAGRLRIEFDCARCQMKLYK